MTEFDPDDKRLVKFLKQYRPIAPQETVNLEQQLMESIDSQPVAVERKRYSLLHLASVTVGALLVSLLGYRFFTPSTTTAELEIFMVNSWDGALGNESFSSPIESPETDWLILGDRDTQDSLDETEFEK